MLKIFYGSDTFLSRTKLGKELEGYLKKDAAVERYDEYSLDLDALRELIAVKDLFGGKTVVVLDSVLENETKSEGLLDLLEEFEASPNTFLLLAGDVPVKIEKQFRAATDSVELSSLSKEKKKEEFSVFALADAFARRDKKAAWVLFTKARMKDMGAQEICGTLLWQMRMIVLAHTAKTAAEAGVAEFSYRKAKSFSKTFSKHDAETLLQKLLGVYHFDPRENRGDLNVALERMILSL